MKLRARGNWWLATLAVGTMLLPAPAVAQEADPFAAITMSAELFEFGQRAQDPILMLAAARLRQKVLPLELPDGPGMAGWYSWRAMLHAASAIAPADADAARLAARLDEEAPRGTLKGPAATNLRIAASGSHQATHRFKGKEFGVVYIESGATSALVLEIADSQGVALCFRPSTNGRALCRWPMARDGDVVVRVRNLADNAANVLQIIN